MEGWARVEPDAEPEWKARWAERERRFFAHDRYVLSGLGPRCAIFTPASGPRLGDEERLGDVHVLRREIRIADQGGHSVLDVRQGSGRWPKGVFHYETEQIGTIRRSEFGWPPRSWTLADAHGDGVAVVRAAILGSKRSVLVGRREVGQIRGGVLDLTPDPDRWVDRRLAVAALVAIVLQPDPNYD
jgi:hypothetical protein